MALANITVDMDMHNMLAGLVLSLPLVAAATQPTTAGVWKGTLGKNIVALCINNDQDGGSYYYEKHRRPIQLERNGDGWTESDGTGKWVLTISGAGIMAGTWNSPKGGAALPIRLRLVSSQADPKPCASDAYNAALETMPQLETGAEQTFLGYKYRTLRIADVETLELRGTGPALQIINGQLRDMLPKSIEDLGEYFPRRRQFLGQTGLDAEDETSATPEFWNGEFVTIRFNRWAAGFGRRGSRSDYLTWDLTSGSSVNLWEWFIATPKVEKGDKRHPLFHTAPATPACRKGYYGKGVFQLTLEAGAVRFWEEAYGDGCEEEIRISYSRLAPILSDKGKLAISRLLGNRQQ